MKSTFETVRLSVSDPKLYTPLTIVQVSDLHDACYGAEQNGLIDAIRAERPDIIVCTGDLFNRRNADAYRNAYRLIERAVKLAPVYVVEGNHEAALGAIGRERMDAVAARGATVLRDNARIVSGVNLIGLRQKASAETLRTLVDPKRFNLVLCHRPELFGQYAGTGADLILCGHAHGGQVQIGRVALYAPQQGWFPRYIGGLYEQNGTKMIVSRGLGDTIPIPRIRVPHELNVLRLLPAKKEETAYGRETEV